MAHPLLQVFPGQYACPDICNLLRYLTERVYFLLKEAYPNGRFQEIFGYVFAEYVNTFIGQFGLEGNLFRTFWPSPYFVNSTAEACDALLFSSDVAVVIETKARLLMLREKYSGDPKLAWRGMAGIVGKPNRPDEDPKGIFQLSRNIARMIRGDEIHSCDAKFRLPVTAKVIPTLVTYEDAVSLGAVRRWANVQLREALAAEGVDLARIEPLLILNTHDVERLEALTRKTPWVEIFQRFAKYVMDHPDDPIATFDVFSHRTGLKSEDPNTSFLMKTFSRAIEFAIAPLSA